MTRLDTETLKAALVGYQHQLDGIHARMAEIRSALGRNAPANAIAAATARPTRRISAAGRARIAAAQRKRWAESRRQAGPSQPVKPKRRLSAAGRAAIVAATKKRWAAVRAANASAAAAAKQSPKHRAPKQAPGKKATVRKGGAKPAPAPVPQTAGE